MLKTKIKASSIANLTDARYFAAWGVDWLGFDLQTISVEDVKTMKDWLEGPVFVGEFGVQDEQRMEEIVSFLGLDAIQINMFATPPHFLKQEEIQLFQEIVIETTTNEDNIQSILTTNESLVDTFIIDLSKNAFSWNDIINGTVLGLDTLNEWCKNFNILLDIDQKAANWMQILEQSHAIGFSVKGGEEEKVGYKSFDAIDNLFEALAIEE